MTKATKVIALRKNRKQVPEPTLRRLPGYLFFLEKVREQGVMNISAPRLEKNSNAIQLR